MLFETSGLEIFLTLNGNEIWNSHLSSPLENADLAQASIPLPLIRFLPTALETIQDTAFANRLAFPAGAAALSFVLVFGLFLLGLLQKKPDFSLLTLLAALLGLISFRLIQEQRYYFLPEPVSHLLGHPRIGLFILAALLLYLAMNRRRRFWMYFGTAAAASAFVFGLCFLVSLLLGGRFANITVYWLTLWLAFTAAVISAFGMAVTFIDQQTQAHSLRLKNKRISENYRFLEEKMAETAALRHEFRHQLTAMDCLCQKDDMEGMRQLLTRMMQEQADQTPVFFTKNHTINTILQDAAARAKQLNLSFRASAFTPEELPIPDQDLCTLLLNMLDNALEGAAKVSPEHSRHLHIQIKMVNQYLAVKCENSFDGIWKKDKDGNLLTTKEDTLSHGFGCRQMRKIAEKYDSTILFHPKNDTVFVVETVLKLPVP